MIFNIVNHLCRTVAGLAPAFLVSEGYITPASTALDIRDQFSITRASPAIIDTIDEPPEVFSRVLREELHGGV